MLERLLVACAASAMTTHAAHAARSTPNSKRCATGCATRSRASARRRLAFGHGTDQRLRRGGVPAAACAASAARPARSRSSTRSSRSPSARRSRSCSSAAIDERVPAAYLTHEAWLGEFRFYVDERVIIPRSFIAELLPGRARALRRPTAQRSSSARSIFARAPDASPILLAHAYPARRHRRRRHLVRRARRRAAQRQRLRPRRPDQPHPLGPVRQPVRARRYDLIISNPPYVTTMAMDELPPEYRHEPALALAGGDDGLDAVRTILQQGAAVPAAGRAARRRESATTRDAAELAFPRMPFTWLSTPSSEAKRVPAQARGHHRRAADSATAARPDCFVAPRSPLAVRSGSHVSALAPGLRVLGSLALLLTALTIRRTAGSCEPGRASARRPAAHASRRRAPAASHRFPPAAPPGSRDSVSASAGRERRIASNPRLSSR